MPSINFEVWCGVCGEGVCGTTDVDYNHHGISLRVTCPSCKSNTEFLENRSDAYDESIDIIRTLEERIAELENELLSRVEATDGHLAKVQTGYDLGIDMSI